MNAWKARNRLCCLHDPFVRSASCVKGTKGNGTVFQHFAVSSLPESLKAISNLCCFFFAFSAKFQYSSATGEKFERFADDYVGAEMVVSKSDESAKNEFPVPDKRKGRRSGKGETKTAFRESRNSDLVGKVSQQVRFVSVMAARECKV